MCLEREFREHDDMRFARSAQQRDRVDRPACRIFAVFHGKWIE